MQGADFCDTHLNLDSHSCSLDGLLCFGRSSNLVKGSGLSWNLASPLPGQMILGKSLNLSNSVKWEHQSCVLLEWLWGSHEIMCVKWPGYSSWLLPNISPGAKSVSLSFRKRRWSFSKEIGDTSLLQQPSALTWRCVSWKGPSGFPWAESDIL